MRLNLVKNNAGTLVLSNLICLFLLFLGATAMAKDHTELWNRAGHFYEQKQYDSAARLYVQLEQEDVKSAALYYNLGNTYYRLNETALAILYFEKAHKANPGSRKIADNLALAQSRIHNPLTPAEPIFFISWWNDFIRFLPPPFWAVFTLVVFIILLGFIYIGKTGRKPVPHAGRWLSLIVVVLFCSALVFYVGRRRITRNNKAVVMKENAPLYHQANDLGTSISVPEGTTILIDKEKSEYYYVELPNGANGWMPKNVITKVSGQ